jgi:multidrug transporter EmrE-like cation transporter
MTTFYYISIGLAILCSVLYHIFIKLTPGNVHPVVSLIATYGMAAIICFGLLLLLPLKTRLGQSFKQLNWASYALAAALVGLEMGFLLAYRAGWPISLSAIVVNVAVTVLLMPIGLLLFEEELSFVNVAGILLSIVGLIMMNLK